MKIKFYAALFFTLVLIFTIGWGSNVVLAETLCNTTFVTQSGNTITVLPTGADDTKNLQCAFDAAIVAGPGIDLQLVDGTYYTAQIIVNGFHGNFYGAGSKSTTITNLPNLYVTPVDFYFSPPSAANPWPSLLVFIEGNFIVSDLAIHIRGDHGTTGWTIFGIQPPITELAHGIAILGPYADAQFKHILVEGEPADNSLLGYNLINGIFYEGFIGEMPLPISGTYKVVDSTFRRVGSGTPIANLYQANVVINNDIFEDVFLGMDGGDFVHSSLEFSHNKVNAYIGVDIYNIFTLEDIESTFLIKNNVFQGAIGPILEQTFGERNDCLFLGNNVQKVTDIGILLGSEISDCTIVGGSNKTNVLDLGTGNVLVGVNNIGMGVGPEIQTLLKRR